MNIRFCVLLLAIALSPVACFGEALSQTWVSGRVLTSDNMVVTSGVVALEKGELHGDNYLFGGRIFPDGTFAVAVSSGGEWGLHVYTEGYFYFPIQLRVREKSNNVIPVVLPPDTEKEDNPVVSDIKFSRVTDKVMRITMIVKDPSGNLGPQMLAIDAKEGRSYRLVPEKGDIKDKKSNFPEGLYVSPFIPASLDREELGEWFLVVSDHRCSNSPIYNGGGKSIARPLVPYKEKLKCELPGVWKSNFDKVYRFSRDASGGYEGSEMGGGVIIDSIIESEGAVKVSFRFEGQKGDAALELGCAGDRVSMKGPFVLPSRSGDWSFTKLKNDIVPRTGEELFNAHCSYCHYPDKSEAKAGPGLKGLHKKQNLPATGKPATEENLKERVRMGGKRMPPLGSLGDSEVLTIVKYLKAL